MPIFSKTDTETKFATNIIIRKIQKNDNKQLALLIRAIFDEFDAPKENSVYSDSETDSLFELFNKNKKSEYFVAEQNGKILGGCGYFPTAELPEDCAEIARAVQNSGRRVRNGEGSSENFTVRSPSFAEKTRISVGTIRLCNRSVGRKLITGGSGRIGCCRSSVLCCRSCFAGCASTHTTSRSFWEQCSAQRLPGWIRLGRRRASCSAT